MSETFDTISHQVFINMPTGRRNIGKFIEYGGNLVFRSNICNRSVEDELGIAVTSIQYLKAIGCKAYAWYDMEEELWKFRLLENIEKCHQAQGKETYDYWVACNTFKTFPKQNEPWMIKMEQRDKGDRGPQGSKKSSLEKEIKDLKERVLRLEKRLQLPPADNHSEVIEKMIARKKSSDWLAKWNDEMDNMKME